MSAVTLEDTVTLGKDTVFRDLNGEAAILHLGSGTTFGINAVGTRIWHSIERHGRLDAVLDALCQEDEASRDELQRDLLEHVGRLADQRNRFADRIEFIQALSTDVTLPERVDIVISDIGGVLPWFQHHIPSIADARRRLLAPGVC